jgi:hypothetical protein
VLRARVRAAFFADAERLAALRLLAAFFAWRDSAVFEAALRGSRLSAFFAACERVREGAFLLAAFFVVAFFEATFFVVVFFAPFFAGTFMPSRRASDRPIAIACLVERAPCLPSRTWWISWRTYSPAWVLADLPSRLSFAAASRVFLSGIDELLFAIGGKHLIDPCVGAGLSAPEARAHKKRGAEAPRKVTRASPLEIISG